MDIEKATKIIKYKIKKYKEELEIELEDKIDEPRIAYLLQQKSAIETVLAELEKKDKQIEQYLNMLATNDMLHVLECEKKDKIIKELEEKLSERNMEKH